MIIFKIIYLKYSEIAEYWVSLVLRLFRTNILLFFLLAESA